MLSSRSLIVPLCSLVTLVMLGSIALRLFDSEPAGLASSGVSLEVQRVTQDSFNSPEQKPALFRIDSAKNVEPEIAQGGRGGLEAFHGDRVIDIGDELDADELYQDFGNGEEPINFGEDLDVDAVDSYTAYEEPVSIGDELDVDSMAYQEPGATVNIGPDLAVDDRYRMEGYQDTSSAPVNIGADIDVPAGY
ncbi:MAG: hypothetical protein ABJ056_01090 [Halioglobus sp.]